MNYAATTLQRAAMDGFRRLRLFRAARLQFIKAYAGHYYNREQGTLGQEPLNMAFTAIRALVPNIISRNPKNVVGSEYLEYRDYGKLLGMGLDLTARRMNLPPILQRGIVDAIFTLGIFKVGLMTSGSLVYFGDEGVDPGTLFVNTTDFDNFTFDPDTTQLEEASFLGERMRVERDEVLESGLYDNAVVERMPSSAEMILESKQGVRNLSDNQSSRRMLSKLHDYVDMIELWLRGPQVLVTVPFTGSTNDRFLREESYVGPIDGPYEFLSLTPPVPNNPIPVQLAGVWHDLHWIGNRIVKKTLDQAEAQKSILGYQRQYADDAQEIVDAKNLDVVGMMNPERHRHCRHTGSMAQRAVGRFPSPGRLCLLLRPFRL
ncbi:hypothetical protein LCGC14_2528340 [marine sediment metagenome]|uniref:Uncharacterized protein n=1 Tax=marine sediment metagenome TaxID=412755 RepID=A0A0F9D5W6_9ZZZZ